MTTPSTGIPPTDEVLIDWAPGETRAAILCGGQPWELLLARTSRPVTVGSIYLGRVIGIDRGLGAAFVDIGETRAAMLKLPRRSASTSKPIHEGQSLLVQTIRDAFADKGAALTIRLAFPGRYLVYTPGRPGLAASRRIPDPETRRRLQGAVMRTIAPDEGVVLRTAAAHADEKPLEAEIEWLRTCWRSVEEMARGKSPPLLLHRDLPPLAAFLRDHLPADPVPVRVDDRRTLAVIHGDIEAIAPEYAAHFELHERPIPLLEDRGLEDEIEAALRRDWPLPGGGSIAIERTRALTAIDVDTGNAGGRRSGGSDRQSVNLAAAREVARLVRFRNISGLIAIDFAGGASNTAARTLAGAIRSGFEGDRAAVRFGGLSEFGLFEMSRERLGPSLAEILGDFPVQDSEPNPESRIIAELRRLVRSRPAPPDCRLTLAKADEALLRGPLAPALREAEERLGYSVTIVTKA